jgi:hypothetical protein
MRKKIALIAAAGLLTTATIVTATTVSTGKKPASKAVKTEVAKEKKSQCNRERTRCFDF